MANSRSGITYTLACAFKTLSTPAGVPDWHSKDQGMVRADRHVQSVMDGKTRHWQAGLRRVLCCPKGRRTIHSTAMLSVFRQATVKNPQVSNGIEQVWIVLMLKRKRLVN